MDQYLNSVFQALSDSTRRSILLQLRQGDVCVTDLAARYDMSMPAVTKHLNILEKAGLVSRMKVGRQRICRAEPKQIDGAIKWLEYYQDFWGSRLDSLKDFIENKEGKS